MEIQLTKSFYLELEEFDASDAIKSAGSFFDDTWKWQITTLLDPWYVRSRSAKTYLNLLPCAILMTRRACAHPHMRFRHKGGRARRCRALLKTLMVILSGESGPPPNPSESHKMVL
eukprot:752843-Hanusia_phi.AAC.7